MKATIDGEVITCDTCLSDIETNQEIYLYNDFFAYCSEGCAFEGYRELEYIDPDDPECEIQDFEDISHEFEFGKACDLMVLDSNIVSSLWLKAVREQNQKEKKDDA